ncbi:MAG: hypothetical protein USCAAHI_00154 [Beijerinckiaceae bacterium]|nr:MAG: hypothetical protein USCAAHI_00154 [Beijerinckiaceae bacterium]
MFGTGLGYCLRHPIQTVAAVASDPVEAWTVLRDIHAARRDRPIPPDLYEAEDGWEHRLHDLLGVPWPCEAISEFWALWPGVIGELQGKGIRVGPESFKTGNDGDAGLVRAIWCLTRHLRPSNVVETGVAHGITSRFILEALEKMGLAICGALTDRHWNRCCASKSVWQLATDVQSDGPLAQVGDIFRPYFLNWARSIFSFTTVRIANGTFASRLNALGQVCGQAARSWSMTSMPIGFSKP